MSRTRAPRTAPTPEVEADAFAELYEAYGDRVYRYLLVRTSRPQEAEELTSATFLRAFANLGRYRGRGSGFGAWLMTIAHNLLVNWYRDRGRRPPTAPLEEALSIPSETPGPEARLLRQESIRQVREALGSLAPDRRRLVALKYARGMSNAEIGRMMGRSEGAVKALHHRTLRQLQAELARRGGEPEAGSAPRRAAGTGRDGR